MDTVQELTTKAYNMLYDAAQTQHGWTYVLPGQEGAADELMRLGLVRHMTVPLRPAPVSWVTATVAGWVRIRATWPTTPYALGSFNPPPQHWTPRAAAASGGDTDEQRYVADCVAQAMGEDAQPTLPASVARATTAGPATSARNVIVATSGLKTHHEHEDQADVPAASVADLVAFIFGQARNRLGFVAERFEAQLQATVNRRAYRTANGSARQAWDALAADRHHSHHVRASWMRIWAAAQVQIAACHEMHPGGHTGFHVDGRSYSEVRRQSATLANALGDALTTPIGAARPPAPTHIELVAGSFLDDLPRANPGDLDITNPASRLSTTMDQLRPVCGFAVEAIPRLLGQR